MTSVVQYRSASLRSAAGLNVPRTLRCGGATRNDKRRAIQKRLATLRCGLERSSYAPLPFATLRAFGRAGSTNYSE